MRLRTFRTASARLTGMVRDQAPTLLHLSTVHLFTIYYRLVGVVVRLSLQAQLILQTS